METIGALLIYPKRKAQTQGRSIKKCETTAHVKHSRRQGRKASLLTVAESFLRATGSSPRPARIRITVRAIRLDLKNGFRV